MRNKKASVRVTGGPDTDHPTLRPDADILEQLRYARATASRYQTVRVPDAAHLGKCRDLAIEILDLLIDVQRLYKQYSYSPNPTISEILETADSTDLRAAPDNLARYLKAHYSDALVVESATEFAMKEHRTRVGFRLNKEMVCYTWRGSAQELRYDVLLLAHTLSDHLYQSEHRGLEESVACSPMWLYTILKKRTISTFVLSPPVPAPKNGATLDLLISPSLAHYSLNERVKIVEALGTQPCSKIKDRLKCLASRS